MKQSRSALRKRAAVLTVAVSLAISTAVAGAAIPAHAAPPGNDSIANARTITGIPTRIVQATREATSSANDGECVGGDSVWYRFRPTTTRTARVVTIGSNFDTMLAVFRGPRDNRTRVACNDDRVGAASAVRVRFEAGGRYWIAVSACCSPNGVGGRSVLRMYAPRPTSVDVSLDSVQTGAVSGRLFASGTVTCGTPSVAEIRVVVSQRVGTHVARGSRWIFLRACEASSRAWSLQVDSRTGVAFQEGTASLTIQAHNFDGFRSAATETTTNVAVGTNPNRMTPE